MNRDDKTDIEAMRQNYAALHRAMAQQDRRVTQWKTISCLLLMVIGLLFAVILDLHGCIHGNPDYMHQINPGETGL